MRLGAEQRRGGHELRWKLFAGSVDIQLTRLQAGERVLARKLSTAEGAPFSVQRGWQRSSEGSKASLVEEGMWKLQLEYLLHVIAQSRR